MINIKKEKLAGIGVVIIQIQQRMNIVSRSYTTAVMDDKVMRVCVVREQRPLSDIISRSRSRSQSYEFDRSCHQRQVSRQTMDEVSVAYTKRSSGTRFRQIGPGRLPGDAALGM